MRFNFIFKNKLEFLKGGSGERSSEHKNMEHKIIKLNQSYHETVMAFLLPEKAFNLFIIGDIENFGYKTDFHWIYGEYIDEVLVSVLLKYRDNLVYYSTLDQATDQMIDLIRAQKAGVMSGKETMILPIIKNIPHKKYRKMYFAELTELSPDIEVKHSVRYAKDEDDLKKIYQLLQQIDEFDSQTWDFYRESAYYKLASDVADTLYLIENEKGEVIATGTTGASNQYSSMVMGIATSPSHRGEGLATSVVYNIAEDYVKQGRSLCLFYDNPKAGRIYERIGFKPIGRWSMVNFDEIE